MQTRRWLAAMLALVCVGGLTWAAASFIGGARVAAAGSGVQGWEYMVVHKFVGNIMWIDVDPTLGHTNKAKGMNFTDESQDVQLSLDAAGSAGWELVAVVPFYGTDGTDQGYVFKRPLP